MDTKHIDKIMKSCLCLSFKRLHFKKRQIWDTIIKYLREQIFLLSNLILETHYYVNFYCILVACAFLTFISSITSKYWCVFVVCESFNIGPIVIF